MSDDKGPRCTSWLKKKVGQHANVRETVADLHCKCGETVKIFKVRVERVLAFLQKNIGPRRCHGGKRKGEQG